MNKSVNINKSITPTLAFLYARSITIFIKTVFNVINVQKHIPCLLSHLSEKMERKETLFHFVRYKTFFLLSIEWDAYDHVDDGVDGSHLGGPGVVCSREVLSVALVRGDEWQPGVLIRHKNPDIVITPGHLQSFYSDCWWKTVSLVSWDWNIGNVQRCGTSNSWQHLCVLQIVSWGRQ